LQLALCVLAFATVVFTGGFLSAHYLTESDSVAQIATVRKRVAAEQQHVEAASESVTASVAALSSRVGALQAHIIRLNALGRQLIKMAGIDPAEFDFAAPPARGGPVINLSAAAGAPLRDRLSRTSVTLHGLDHQLSALENILLQRNLQKEMRPSGRPIEGGWISSFYGRRVDPLTGKAGFHPGIDFADKKGTPVHAVAAGVVTWAGPWYGYGNLVEIDNGYGYATRYGHNAKILVKVGEAVSKGQVISLMGSTGHSTGPHVHLEVLYHGHRVNPLKFVRGD
jgi:murein DD-endopeptidase MepM/ murein hydrolase activator NlpD